MSFDFPSFSTDRLTLRVPQAQDLAPWTAFFMSERSQYIRETEPTEALAWRAFGHAAGMWMLRGYGSFVITHKDVPDTALGMVGPWFPVGWPEPELGWTIWNTSIEGTGIAFEAVQAARRYAYDVLAWDQPISYIARDNARSIKLAERLGATLDPSAQHPFAHKDILVYRHPKVLP